MHATLLAIAVLALAVWIGAIVYQAFIVAPAVFDCLDGAQARRFLRTIFPRFYVLGLVCGGALLLAVVLLGALDNRSSSTPWLAVAAATMVAAAAISLGLVPRINAARDAGSAGQARFRRLHGASVALTLLVLALGAVSLVVLSAAGSLATG